MNEFNENEKRIMARLRELWRKEEENNSNYSDCGCSRRCILLVWQALE